MGWVGLVKKLEKAGNIQFYNQNICFFKWSLILLEILLRCARENIPKEIYFTLY